ATTTAPPTPAQPDARPMFTDSPLPPPLPVADVEPPEALVKTDAAQRVTGATLRRMHVIGEAEALALVEKGEAMLRDSRQRVRSAVEATPEFAALVKAGARLAAVLQGTQKAQAELDEVARELQDCLASQIKDLTRRRSKAEAEKVTLGEVAAVAAKGRDAA